MRELQTHTAEEILTTVYKPIEFIIERLLAQSLYILAGAQKIGKSSGAKRIRTPTMRNQFRYEKNAPRTSH